MAVYVVLEFQDDERAKEFVADNVNNTGAFSNVAEVVGVFKRPTQFCQCGISKGVGYTRGKKYGWWVCARCARPTEKWSSRDSWFSFLGTNLLPPEISGEYRPKGWETEASWTFLLGETISTPIAQPLDTTI